MPAAYSARMFHHSGHTRLRHGHKQIVSTSRPMQSAIEGKEYLGMCNGSDGEATVPDYKSPAELVALNESDTRILGAPRSWCYASWCRSPWVYATAGGVDHASRCTPLWVYATADGVDHFGCTP